jgi:D-tyrosyl-tRNA(Tyr) deacylase
MVVLLGIEDQDEDSDIEWLVHKIASLRIFGDGEGKMNLSIREINGEILVVSQFTLYASTRKGNRPSFIAAAKPDKAIPLYERFIEMLSGTSGVRVTSGIFGADMQIHLVNDGPVTILMDSKQKE